MTRTPKAARWATALKRASDEFWSAWLTHADRLGPRTLACLAVTSRHPYPLTVLAMRISEVNAQVRAYVRREIGREE